MSIRCRFLTFDYNDKIIRRPLGHKNNHINVGSQKMKKKKEERKDITYHIAFDNKSVYCIAWELKMPPSTHRDKLLSEGYQTTFSQEI